MPSFAPTLIKNGIKSISYEGTRPKSSCSFGYRMGFIHQQSLVIQVSAEQHYLQQGRSEYEMAEIL